MVGSNKVKYHNRHSKQRIKPQTSTDKEDVIAAPSTEGDDEDKVMMAT